MNPVYRYFISGRQVYPIKSNLTKDYDRDSGQYYFRSKLIGKLTFINLDYNYIEAKSFDFEYLFSIERLNNSNSWDLYFSGTFKKTDCSWNTDNKTVEVSITTHDNYNDILAGLDKTYNLIKLNPAVSQINIAKRPLIQIYSLGSNTVSCFIGGTYFEQDATVISDASTLINTYKFALASTIIEFDVQGVSNPVNIISSYSGKSTGPYYGNAAYKMTYEEYPEYDEYNNPTGETVYKYKIIRTSDNAAMFESDGLGSPFGTIITMSPVLGSGVIGSLTVIAREIKFYGRYLLDVDFIQGHTTYNIPNNDISSNNRNYKKCYGYSIDLILPSSRYSTSPNEYGINDYGSYFLWPYQIGSPRFYPVSKNNWSNTSYWFRFDYLDFVLEASVRKYYILKDSYTICDVIKVLLVNIAPSITHEATVEYSQFLYSQYNPISGHSFTLLMSPKSNVTSGDYDKPAKKADITLKDILDMLRDVYHCYWYIEDNKLKIEHITWFNNGGSYTGGPTVGVDLTAVEDIRNNKKLAFNTNNWVYDKDVLPERIEYNWMDTVSDAFIGYPVNILSGYVAKGNIQAIQISKFTTDIDYMLLNPEGVSKDGFALFAATRFNLFSNVSTENALNKKLSNGVLISDTNYNTTHYIPIIGNLVYTINNAYIINWFDINNTFISGFIVVGGIIDFKAPSNAYFCRVTVLNTNWLNLEFKSKYYNLPFIERLVSGTNLLLQNGYLSWITIQPVYHIYDMPAKYVTINKEEVVAVGLIKSKKQVVKFPTTDDPNLYTLVRTYLGNGQIVKVSINLQTRQNEITLAYDTE